MSYGTKKTLLFGGSGFFGPVILSKNPDIISVGRTKPPIECKNKHIQLDDLNQITKIKTSMLCVSGCLNPDIHLFTQSKGLVKWDDKILTFKPLQCFSGVP